MLRQCLGLILDIFWWVENLTSKSTRGRKMVPPEEYIPVDFMLGFPPRRKGMELGKIPYFPFLKCFPSHWWPSENENQLYYNFLPKEPILSIGFVKVTMKSMHPCIY